MTAFFVCLLVHHLLFNPDLDVVNASVGVWNVCVSNGSRTCNSATLRVCVCRHKTIETGRRHCRCVSGAEHIDLFAMYCMVNKARSFEWGDSDVVCW